jgi:hypothetical protein
MSTKVEVLERLDKWMLWLLSLTLIAEVALNFVGSYGHIYVEGMHYGERGTDGRILPITIDGMLLALAIANVFAARFNRRSPWLRFGLILGVGGTVAANGAYGAAWGITGGLLSLWAPVALFVTTECGLFVFRLVADLLKEAREEADKDDRKAFVPAPKMAPWETEALQAVPNGTANEPEGKAVSPSLNTDAWRGLNGIGLRNGGQ